MLDQNSDPVLVAEFASPGLGRSYLGEPGLASLYGAFAGEDGRLDLYAFNEGTHRWDKTDVLDSRPGPIEGRPALEWTSEVTDIDFPGRFYLMYIAHDTRANVPFRQRNRRINMMTSYVRVQEQPDGSLTKSLRVGLEGPFDNVWLHAFGIDLFFEAGRDSNLRAVFSRSSDNPDQEFKIWFRPKADGINDFVMTDYNDWEVLRLGLCKNVVNPGGLVVNPITCPVS